METELIFFLLSKISMQEKMVFMKLSTTFDGDGGLPYLERNTGEIYHWNDCWNKMQTTRSRKGTPLPYTVFNQWSPEMELSYQQWIPTMVTRNGTLISTMDSNNGHQKWNSHINNGFQNGHQKWNSHINNGFQQWSPEMELSYQQWIPTMVTRNGILPQYLIFLHLVHCSGQCL